MARPRKKVDGRSKEARALKAAKAVAGRRRGATLESINVVTGRMAMAMGEEVAVSDKAATDAGMTAAHEVIGRAALTGYQMRVSETSTGVVLVGLADYILKEALHAAMRSYHASMTEAVR